ncbi:MAG: GNAT family N-acyltransferase [Pseudomonadota bacterium]
MLQRKPRHYRSHFVEGEADLLKAQRLRYACFNDGAAGIDADALDTACQHILITDAKTGDAVCTFRFLELSDGSEIDHCYSAAYYNLDALRTFDHPLLELGRFCIDPQVADPSVVRLAWSEITRLVDQRGIEMMFGCSSFAGTNADSYQDTFALLKERHLGPKRWLPRVKAPNVFQFARILKFKKPNLKYAQKRLPPLLRTYLTMGGWVSDHAVVDEHMNTLHVFTGLEIASIPANRKRLLRADAA